MKTSILHFMAAACLGREDGMVVWSICAGLPRTGTKQTKNKTCSLKLGGWTGLDVDEYYSSEFSACHAAFGMA